MASFFYYIAALLTLAATVSCSTSHDLSLPPEMADQFREGEIKGYWGNLKGQQALDFRVVFDSTVCRSSRDSVLTHGILSSASWYNFLEEEREIRVNGEQNSCRVQFVHHRRSYVAEPSSLLMDILSSRKQREARSAQQNEVKCLFLELAGNIFFPDTAISGADFHFHWANTPRVQDPDTLTGYLVIGPDSFRMEPVYQVYRFSRKSTPFSQWTGAVKIFKGQQLYALLDADKGKLFHTARLHLLKSSTHREQCALAAFLILAAYFIPAG